MKAKFFWFFIVALMGLLTGAVVAEEAPSITIGEQSRVDGKTILPVMVSGGAVSSFSFGLVVASNNGNNEVKLDLMYDQGLAEIKPETKDEYVELVGLLKQPVNVFIFALGFANGLEVSFLEPWVNGSKAILQQGNVPVYETRPRTEQKAPVAGLEQVEEKMQAMQASLDSLLATQQNEVSYSAVSREIAEIEKRIKEIQRQISERQKVMPVLVAREKSLGLLEDVKSSERQSWQAQRDSWVQINRDQGAINALSSSIESLRRKNEKLRQEYKSRRPPSPFGVYVGVGLAGTATSASGYYDSSGRYRSYDSSQPTSASGYSAELGLNLRLGERLAIGGFAAITNVGSGFFAGGVVKYAAYSDGAGVNVWVGGGPMATGEKITGFGEISATGKRHMLVFLRVSGGEPNWQIGVGYRF